MNSIWQMLAVTTLFSEEPDELSQGVIHREIDPAPIITATANRIILEWRDKCIADAPSFLLKRYRVFMNEIRDFVDEESLVNLTFSKDELMKNSYQDRFNRWMEAAARDFYADAERELLQDVKEHLEYCHADQEITGDCLKASYGELGLVTALAGATAAGTPFLAAGSVVSAGGVLGLLGATTIAWPVVAIGGGALATSALFGGFRVSELHDKYVQEFMNDMDKELRKRLFTSPNDSLVEQLQDGIDRAASRILQGVV